MLVDVALEEETGESVRLSSLQALTNLSVMEHHHNHYTRIIQKLYDFLDGQNSGIRLQAAKILVNLSCNQELVPHMLAAKVRSFLIHKILVNVNCNPELVPYMLAAKVRSSLILKILKSISCSAEPWLSRKTCLNLRSTCFTIHFFVSSDAHFCSCIRIMIIIKMMWQSLVFSLFQNNLTGIFTL